MKKIFLLLFLGIYINAYVGFDLVKFTINSYNAISKSNKVLSDEEIEKLSKLSDTYQGTKAVKKYIGKLNLSEYEKIDVYLRIAIHQNKITRKEAIEFYKNLKNSEGFSSTLSKIIGNNINGTKGHLNELRIANEAVKLGFEVVAIGKKFDDGIKKSLTDIDLLLRINNRDILIEAKNYSSNTKMPIDKFKKDLDTLVEYDKKYSNGNSIKVFTFTQKPSDPKLLRQYTYWANKKGVQLVFGSPQEQMEQIKILEQIL